MFRKYARMDEEEHMRLGEESEKMEDEVRRIGAQMSGSENV